MVWPILRFNLAYFVFVNLATLQLTGTVHRRQSTTGGPTMTKKVAEKLTKKRLLMPDEVYQPKTSHFHEYSLK